MTGPATVTLAIDRLVFDGVGLAPGEAARLRARLVRAVERHLARLAAAVEVGAEEAVPLLPPTLVLTGAFEEERLIEEAARRIAEAVRPHLQPQPAEVPEP